MNKSNQPEVDWLIFGLSATLLALVVLGLVACSTFLGRRRVEVIETVL